MSREQTSWTLSLGRWGGTEVRIHIFCFLFAVFTLYLASADLNDSQAVEIAVISLAILLTSVLLHELGHWVAARRLGADVETIVLGPLGGLGPPSAAGEPRAELTILLAGPLMNLAICLALIPALLLFVPGTNVAQLLHPLQPDQLIGEYLWVTGLRLVVWINWVLFIVNLLPAFPFDGGRALRAGLLMCWPDIGRHSAASVVATLAKVAALGLLILAWVSWNDQPHGAVPNWLAMVLLAIFLFFSAKQEEREPEQAVEPPMSEPSELSEAFPDESEPISPFSAEEQEESFTDWLEQRRSAEQDRRREIEAEEERRVDEILALLHRHGMAALSEEDRSLLERVSARYRSRQS